MKREHSIEGELPVGYERLEYIQSTGTQWIDTNVAPSNSMTKVSADVQLSTLSQGETKMFFGNNSGGRYFMMMTTTAGKLSMNCGNSSEGTLDLVVTTYDSARTEISLEKNGNTYIASGYGTTKIGNCGNLPTVNNILVFARNVGTSAYNKIKMLLYSCTIEKDNEPVRILVSALRLSDNKPGLYDLCGSICPLTNTPFYVNAGTGEFLYQ